MLFAKVRLVSMLRPDCVSSEKLCLNSQSPMRMARSVPPRFVAAGPDQARVDRLLVPLGETRPILAFDPAFGTTDA